MAQLIATWLNSDVELSKEVTNFEEDFCNGYLFGELLYKFNQQQDFEYFENKDKRNARLNNFSRLIPTFKALEIKFDSNFINQIIHKQQGVALNLLYQLKMALEKVNLPVDIRITHLKGKEPEPIPVQRIRPTRDAYDKMEQGTIMEQLKRLNKSQKEVDIEVKMQKFKDEASKQLEKAQYMEQQQKQEQLKLYDKKRKEFINKLQRTAGFMEDWQAKGVADWKINQERRRQRELLELHFKIKQSEKSKAKTLDILNQARDETFKGISEFEQTRLGLVQPEAQTYVMAKKSETSKDRDVRRRKLLADQNQLESQEERAYLQSLIFTKLDRQSRPEAELSYMFWKTEQYKQIILDHRKLRESNYTKRKEIDKNEADVKESSLLSQSIENLNQKVELEMQRYNILFQHLQVQRRENRRVNCTKMVSQVVDMVEQIWNFQQEADTKEIWPDFWDNWIYRFEQKTTIENYLLKNYIQSEGSWNFPKLEQDEFIPDIRIPDFPPNNAMFTEIVDILIEKTQKVDIKQLEQKEFMNLPLKLALIGFDFSGRKTQAQFLQEKFNLSVIDFSSLASVIESQCPELRLGMCVSDNLLVNLLEQELLKVSTQNQGWVLVGFPSTLQQIKLMEESLNGYLPDCERERQKDELAREEIKRIFTDPGSLEVKLQKCFRDNINKFSCFDAIFMLEVEPKIIYHRAFGRYFDPVNKIEYHLTDSPPPLNQDQLMERLQIVEEFTMGTLTERLISFENNKRALEN